MHSFCEQDYLSSYYIAEFINSLTNIVYVYYALRSIYRRGLYAPNWDFMSISLLILGISSFLFHATLWRSLQFADEIAVLLLKLSMCYSSLACHDLSFNKLVLHAAAMTVFFVPFSALYIYTGKIIYPVISFASCLVLVASWGVYLLYLCDNQFEKKQLASWKAQQAKAGGLLLIAYILWNLGLEYCGRIRAIRAQIGLPWAFVLELHGCWHILTAMSAGWYMDVLRGVREELGKARPAG
ncbi:hypothetical protein S40288_07057 [Stachybotrys chartarum IBT 40288]|nr:hypothetical protein S40288_07057 [Stachybotrys chartarum IBT 40288]